MGGDPPHRPGAQCLGDLVPVPRLVQSQPRKQAEPEAVHCIHLPLPYALVWEPRGSWKDEEIRDLCQELGLVHSVDPFQTAAVAGAIRYYRLHGKTGYRYTPEDLHVLAPWIEADKDTYLLFNNVSMFEDAQAYRQLDPHAR